MEPNLDFPNRLSLDRRALSIQANNLERHPDCHAKIEDDGLKQEIPVCMGGVAIVGCNNIDVCSEQYGERIQDPTRAHFLHQDPEGRVSGITTVPRAPLVQPEV